jgi:hypothetical protein
MLGWIKLHRQFLEWEWYDEPNTMRLFIHLILKANHKPKKYRGVTINPGQIMTGQDLLSKELGISRQQIRTALKNLESTNEITNETSAQGSIIQIVKYVDFQIATNEITNDQPTTNQRPTTNKNTNNYINSIEDAKTSLKTLLAPFVSDYGRDLVNEFYSYWTEHGPNDKRCRYQKEKSFSVERRLRTWNKNESKFGTKKPKVDRL